jgi:hypothetical protein
VQRPAVEAFGAKFLIKAVAVVLLSLTLAGLQSRTDHRVRLDMQVPSRPAAQTP